MQHNPWVLARYATFVAALLVTAWLLSGTYPRPITVPYIREEDNPQKFHLWTTGASFSYAFTYDPRASDVWMFNSAGGAMPFQQFAPGSFQLSSHGRTNN